MDEEMPALQSPSDSSESEDEPAPQRRPTEQHAVSPRRPLAADVFDSDDSDMDITESDVRFARGLLRQFEQYGNQPPSLSDQPVGNDAGSESSNFLESLFLYSSSEDEDDRGNRRSRSSGRSNAMSPEEMRNQINDIIHRFASLRNRMRDHDEEREPDQLRAHVVVDGLEPVSKGLLSRYEVVRGEDHPKGQASCAVCYEPLDLEPSRGSEDHNPSEPIQTENKKLLLTLPYYATFPEVVAFPCLHLFHSECLFPWLSRKTTCPTCRFDVDPDSLTLNGGSVQRPWAPPAEGVLEAWVQAEEKKRFSCVKEDHLYDQTIPPLGSGYETDESTSSVGSFCTCYDDGLQTL